MKVIGIYKITSPSKKTYIGQALDIYKRWNTYKYMNCNRQPKLYSSFKKHGVENHNFEIVCECDESQLNELEEFYIKRYDCFNTKHGLNLQSGGDKRRHTEETKKKISLGNKNKVVSKESKDKNRLAHLGKKQSIETVEKRVSKFRGKKQLLERVLHRIQARKKNGTNIHSKETKEKMKATSIKNRGKIILDNQNGIFYESIKEAAIVKNIDPGLLRYRLNTNKITTLIYA